jgi:hypothetical protein
MNAISEQSGKQIGVPSRIAYIGQTTNKCFVAEQKDIRTKSYLQANYGFECL